MISPETSKSKKNHTCAEIYCVLFCLCVLFLDKSLKSLRAFSAAMYLFGHGVQFFFFTTINIKSEKIYSFYCKKKTNKS